MPEMNYICPICGSFYANEKEALDCMANCEMYAGRIEELGDYDDDDVYDDYPPSYDDYEI